mgnify:CR=1 FL=1
MDKDAAEWVEKEEPGWSRLIHQGNIFGDNFVRGDASGKRICIQYYFRESDGSIMAKVLFGPEAQGPPGHVHGGCIAAVLDESMGIASWMAGHIVVAAGLNIKFRKMVPLGAPCTIETRVVKVTGRKVKMGAKLLTRSGRVLAEGEAMFISLDPALFDDLVSKAAPLLEKLRGRHAGT